MSGTPGEVSLSSVCASELTAPSRAASFATGINAGRNLFRGDGSRIFATKSPMAVSHSSFGWIQLVFIFASFCVVRRGRQQGGRPIVLSINIPLVKRLNTASKPLRLATHFVQRRKPVVNVKDGVLQSLGHDRSRGLLKLQNEIRVLGARFGIEVWRKTKEQHVAEKIEDRFFHCGVATLGRGDRAVDDLPIFLSYGLPRCQVCSINRKTSDGLAHRARERLERKIAIPAVLLGKPVEHVTQ